MADTKIQDAAKQSTLDAYAAECADAKSTDPTALMADLGPLLTEAVLDAAMDAARAKKPAGKSDETKPAEDKG